jgi:hypothetical protein
MAIDLGVHVSTSAQHQAACALQGTDIVGIELGVDLQICGGTLTRQQFEWR